MHLHATNSRSSRIQDLLEGLGSNCTSSSAHTFVSKTILRMWAGGPPVQRNSHATVHYYKCWANACRVLTAVALSHAPTPDPSRSLVRIPGRSEHPMFTR